MRTSLQNQKIMSVQYWNLCPIYCNAGTKWDYMSFKVPWSWKFAGFFSESSEYSNIFKSSNICWWIFSVFDFSLHINKTNIFSYSFDEVFILWIYLCIRSVTNEYIRNIGVEKGPYILRPNLQSDFAWTLVTLEWQWLTKWPCMTLPWVITDLLWMTEWHWSDY